MTRDEAILVVWGELAAAERANAAVVEDLEARALVFDQLGEQRLMAAALAAADAIRDFDREATKTIARRMADLRGGAT